MGYQLVVSGNRILAYGTDCFYSMGGTVICPETERVYQNATVVNCEKIPSDIDLVGYEYHSGEFVPCAPFGVGDGNAAVVCGNDCKALKDSGIPLGRFGQIAETTYTGSGGNSLSLTFDAVPVVLFITGKRSGSNYDFAIVKEGMLIGWVGGEYNAVYGNNSAQAVTINGNTIKILCTPNNFNRSDAVYSVKAILQGGE